MKQLVTYLSLFGGGVILGVFATKTYFERKYRDISEAEIESVKEVYKRKTIALESEEQKEEVRDAVIGTEANQFGSVLFKDMTPEHMKEMAYQYYTVSKDIPEDHPIEENYKPYMIDVDTFDEVNDGYSKHEYIYYIEDGTLTDASIEAAVPQTDIEEEIINAADTVGVDNLEVFENSDEEVCYIRNESSKSDYEITKVFSSYSSVVGDDY